MVLAGLLLVTAVTELLVPLMRPVDGESDLVETSPAFMPEFLLVVEDLPIPDLDVPLLANTLSAPVWYL